MNNTDYEKFYKQYSEELKKKLSDAGKAAAKKAYVEYFAYAEKRVKEIFHESIQRFYDSYDPEIYTRSHSMFDMLKTVYDPDEPSLTTGLDDSVMTTTRKGGPLYEQVFEQGWHGGASKIAPEKAKTKGYHPSPGTPYWRTPHPGYFRWGRMAEKAKISPKDDYDQAFDKLNEDELAAKFREILQKHTDNMKIEF